MPAPRPLGGLRGACVGVSESPAQSIMPYPSSLDQPELPPVGAMASVRGLSDKPGCPGWVRLWGCPRPCQGPHTPSLGGQELSQSGHLSVSSVSSRLLPEPHPPIWEGDKHQSSMKLLAPEVSAPGISSGHDNQQEREQEVKVWPLIPSAQGSSSSPAALQLGSYASPQMEREAGSCTGSEAVTKGQVRVWVPAPPLSSPPSRLPQPACLSVPRSPHL